MIVLSEFMRRFKDMNMMYKKPGEEQDVFGEHTLIVNSVNPVVKKVLKLNENSENKKKVKELVNHIYDLALLSQNNLKDERLINFIKRSNNIIIDKK